MAMSMEESDSPFVLPILYICAPPTRSLVSSYQKQKIQTTSLKTITYIAIEFVLQSDLAKLTMALIPNFFDGRRSNVFDPFSLDVWDPFEGFPFSGALTGSRPTNEAAQIVNTRVDWKETPEAHVFEVDLPGLKKEEVKVEVEDGGILQISGERRGKHEEKADEWQRVERSCGKFLRRFRLPENAKMEQVKASMKDGVLHVVVPKVEEKKPKVKSIHISG